MPSHNTSLGAPSHSQLPFIVGATVAFSFVGSLIALFFRHLWILDAGGKPLVTDFLEVWVAGRLVLEGHPATPYDWHAHHTAQVAAIGHAFPGFLGWHYPPPYLFAAALLGLLPYLVAFLAWVAITAIFYALVVGRIAGRAVAGVAALALPASLACAMVGQNGFFTAALIGAALLFLEEMPFLGGLLIGLLICKPQLAILFPIVLFASGRGRAFAAASASVAICLAVSWAVFGEATFRAFFHFLPLTEHSVLAHGSAGWSKMQSIYGAARWLGLSDGVGWALQGATTAGSALAAIWLWRGDVPYALKAAGLVTALMLATPYLYMYDFPILAVASAFLWRAGPFDRMEWGGLIFANVLFAIYVGLAVPIGPLMVMIVAGLVLRRAFFKRTAFGFVAGNVAAL